MIEKALEARQALEEHGSQTAAAKALGIARSTLQERLKKLKEPFLSSEADKLGFPADDVTGYWVKSATGSYYVRRDTSVNYNDLRDRFLEEASEYAPFYSKINYGIVGEHLLVIDPADVHFNKLSAVEETGYYYDLKEADKRLRSGVTALLAKALPFGISKIVLVLGNDILNSDNPRRTTTSGTLQDDNVLWWQAFTAAKKAYIAIIEELTQVAHVHLIHVPSNHDFQSGWMLADSVCSWFVNNPNVTAEQGSVSIAHRKYIQFGSNLIGFTHNDGAKEKDLSNLMQYEAREAWGNSRYAYWYLHHLHHKDRKAYGKDSVINIEKDHTGVTVLQTGKKPEPSNACYTEVVRSPSPPDRWHSTNGYVNEQAIECFIHHPDKGQSARFTEYF